MAAQGIVLQDNKIIAEAIRKIARHGLVSKRTGALKGVGQTSGYVVKIHTDDELAGTIDVKEFDAEANENEDITVSGYHEGVYLSAIQDNMSAMVIVPKLYSEVLIASDVNSGNEYVTMYSHVDLIQLDSHDKIIVGVHQREEYQAGNPDAPDIDELELTGVSAGTTYTKDSVTTEVWAAKDDKDSHVVETIDGTHIEQNIGEGKTVTTADGKGYHVEHNNSQLEVGDSEATLSQGSSKVKVTDGTVYVGSDSNADYAVLGEALCDVLADLCGYLAQVKTTTQLGPQPFINMAQFMALQSKIKAAKASHSNFLTSKVRVQK